MPRQPKAQGDPAPDEEVADVQEAIETVSDAAEATPPANGPKIGDTIICTNRLPSPLRPWENPIWIGVIEQPGTDPSRWNGKYSEAAYCVHTKKRKVRYRNPEDPSDSFVQHDKVASLIVLSDEEANLTGLAAIRHFLGVVAAHQFEQHAKAETQGETK
jgi:hypothetical protein